MDNNKRSLIASHIKAFQAHLFATPTTRIEMMSDTGSLTHYDQDGVLWVNTKQLKEQSLDYYIKTILVDLYAKMDAHKRIIENFHGMSVRVEIQAEVVVAQFLANYRGWDFSQYLKVIQRGSNGLPQEQKFSQFLATMISVHQSLTQKKEVVLIASLTKINTGRVGLLNVSDSWKPYSMTITEKQRNGLLFCYNDGMKMNKGDYEMTITNFTASAIDQISAQERGTIYQITSDEG